MAPRDELAGAVVPEGTAPGGEFAVPVVRRRRGEAVQESKSCWRASGNWPTIFNRAMSIRCLVEGMTNDLQQP